jgi:tryptophanyl-tRNA synthetase
MADFTITPWETKGDVNYSKVMQQFGTKPITDALLHRLEKIAGGTHYMLRRKIFFTHRDLDWLLDEYEKGNKFFIYTGRGPSGPVHIGHLTPWIFLKWLQDRFDAEIWFQFTDDEKFMFKERLTLEETEKWTRENMLDVIAMGLDPKRTHFLIDTRHADIMYRQACRVAKKITFSTVKATFGFTNENNIGEIFYTAMQAVPAFLPSVLAGKNVPCLIPYAVDQDAHFRIARDVLPKLGYYKPASIESVFLPGLGGMIDQGKMSSSEEETAIYTTDSPEDVRRKINKYAYSGGQATVEEHRKKGGNPDVDVSYQWLRFFEEDDRKLNKIYNDYRSGKLLSGELKGILIDKLNSFLKKHQEARKRAEKSVDKFIFKQ